jgi:hypothetical protein
VYGAKSALLLARYIQAFAVERETVPNRAPGTPAAVARSTLGSAKEARLPIPDAWRAYHSLFHSDRGVQDDVVPQHSTRLVVDTKALIRRGVVHADFQEVFP